MFSFAVDVPIMLLVALLATAIGLLLALLGWLLPGWLDATRPVVPEETVRASTHPTSLCVKGQRDEHFGT